MRALASASIFVSYNYKKKDYRHTHNPMWDVTKRMKNWRYK